MTRYFLGVDTGATKSHALIADENGRVVGFGQAGPGNWEVVGWEGTRTVLNSIINQAAVSAGIELSQISAAGFGLAGYDWPEDRQSHVEIIQSLMGPNFPFEIVNDAFIGLLAGATDGWGVAVGAGTSCNCYGRNPQGEIGRVGGASYWFGEYAGAGELVVRAIHDVAKAWSKRGPATKLTEAFLESTGAADVVDLLGGLMRDRYRLWAAHAPIVFEVAAAGDTVAQEAIRWAGRELGNLVVGVVRQLSMEDLAFEVVLSGSFYNGSPVIQETMQETIWAVAPQAQLVRLTAPPVVGGVRLGMEQVAHLGQMGLETAVLHLTLIETTKKLIDDQ